ncbi:MULTISPECIES: alkaline phosphatase family protein [Arthrobacter]|uniref:Alkaline phosphatase family protein n=2 Tax=Arthrobacter TaxID=1663 RepID=A0ABU9KP65_9MICC|nr:alkaline phosphatase family protein [Arthrobacter sp. YJM1]MDP5228722.1 alkaline phosphatase family protein [Arthrobacter sp. YJM1]
MKSSPQRVAAAALGVALATAGIATAAVAAPSATAQNAAPQKAASGKHVLLLSVDGLHQSDLDWYVKAHPASALAALVNRGTSYTQAQTPVPSDSFPGMVGQVTGGNPGTTGVYYDDTWNRALFPAGTTDCSGTAPGGEVSYTEAADRDPNALDAGQGLANLPNSILQMTGTPRSLLDPAQLPVDPKTCKPVYPNQYLKVNTVFEVAKKAGLRTAWSDKHAAYDILSGPSGQGIDDLFAPEINSSAAIAGFNGDWTKDNAATQQYDSYKVQAVLNEIGGKDHSGTTKVGEPGVFGMNFQSVSTAQKLPKSDGLAGGYLADGTTPGPLLSKALDYIDTQVGALTSAIAASPDAKKTTVILSAKHGQSPMDPASLKRVDDGPIVDGLNTAWRAAGHAGDLVAFSTNDDVMQLWFTEHTQAAADFAKKYLEANAAAGNDINGAPLSVQASGLSTVYAGAEVASYFHTLTTDERIPDVFGIVQHGVVYTGGKGKIAEHGGADAQDRHVPIVVASGVGGAARTVTSAVETTQIAPTILRELGLNVNDLQAVRIEGTRVLPQH